MCRQDRQGQSISRHRADAWSGLARCDDRVLLCSTLVQHRGVHVAARTSPLSMQGRPAASCFTRRASPAPRRPHHAPAAKATARGCRTRGWLSGAQVALQLTSAASRIERGPADDALAAKCLILLGLAMTLAVVKPDTAFGFPWASRQHLGCGDRGRRHRAQHRLVPEERGHQFAREQRLQRRRGSARQRGAKVSSAGGLGGRHCVPPISMNMVTHMKTTIETGCTWATGQ